MPKKKEIPASEQDILARQGSTTETEGMAAPALSGAPVDGVKVPEAQLEDPFGKGEPPVLPETQAHTSDEREAMPPAASPGFAEADKNELPSVLSPEFPNDDAIQTVRPTALLGMPAGTLPDGFPSEEIPADEAHIFPDEATEDLPLSDRRRFFELDFRELDRRLSPEERQEWSSIYASYRGGSALSGTIIGVDRISLRSHNADTGDAKREDMYCAIVIPHRVRIVIPATEMWEDGKERPSFVLQNMVGAHIHFIIMKVDREGGFAIASRRQASRVRRLYFSRRPALQMHGTRLQCQVLAVGPRRCLVECYGHDMNLTQRELRYTAIPDLRTEYHPGQELDCLVKGYDPDTDALEISVKETESNPFDGAALRHPAGSRRQAIIAGKYGGGVFCNLPDGTVCMCNYAYQHEDSDFRIGDTVILVIQRHEMKKRQIYGKILSKW